MEIRLNNKQLFLASTCARKGFSFDEDMETHVFPLNHIDQLKEFEKDQKVFGNAIFKRLVTHNIENLQQPLKLVPNRVLGVNADLFPHQQDGVSFLISHTKSLLASDLGLGKTLMAITAMVLTECKNVLIVCPAPLKTNWLKEIQRFTPQLVAVILKSKKDALLTLMNTTTPTIFIMSYQLVGPCLVELVKRNWNMLVCDEAHYVKNPKSQRSKALLRLSKRCSRVVLLSGTPANKTGDLWHLLKIIHPTLFAEFYTHESPRGMKALARCNEKHFYFADRYLVPEVVRVGGGRLIYVFKRRQRLRELHALTSAFILRQKLDESSLPPLIKEYVTICSASTTQKKHMDDTLKRIETLKTTNLFEADCLFMALIRETGKFKQKHILEYLLMRCETQTVDDELKKIIVFAHHHEMSDFLHDGLEKQAIKHVVVRGDTPMKQRDELLSLFERDPLVQVGVLSLGACSTGLNLTFCRLVLCAELTFDADKHRQSEKRSHRIGQTQKVVFQYLAMADTTDDALWRSLASKAATSAAILDA